MAQHATGTFEVKLTPEHAADGGESLIFGRLTLSKEFHGDLIGHSQGLMLATSSPTVKSSAGYVAIERVTGTLHDKRGSFHLQHHGIMTRGEGVLTINVVPDTGTEELTGLAGTMTITIEEGKHSYDLEYTITS